MLEIRTISRFPLLRFVSTFSVLVLAASIFWPGQLHAQDLVGTYDLYSLARFRLDRDLRNPVNTMVITEHKDDVIHVRSPSDVTRPDRAWTGVGKVDSKMGYYEWKFADGKTGRTDFVITADNDLIAHVQISDPAQSSFNWWYLARRR